MVVPGSPYLSKILNKLRGLLLSFSKNPLQHFIEREYADEREGTLTVRDDRSGASYKIPIIRNAVPALAFRQICIEKCTNPKEQYENGLRVIDPGYRNTAVKLSNITYINGNKGVILYRGISIESLIGKSYEEVTHLLVWGSLPTMMERLELQQKLAAAMVVPPNVHVLIASFPPETPAMVIMTAAVTGFQANEPELIPAYVGKNLYNGNSKLVDEQIIRTLATCAVIVCLTFCHKSGRKFHEADPNLGYIENILCMGGFVDNNPNVCREKAHDILTKLWVLYADHEMTNSTATFLQVASTLTDPLSALTACATSAYGLLHGGAIDAAYRGMKEIGSVENVHELIQSVVDKKCRLSGYGHRIYKKVDPRAVHVRKMLEELTKSGDIEHMDPILAIAMEIDRQASTHPYFTKRNLQANTDLYGSFVYTALGIPPEFSVPLAVVSRVPGVLAHWKEQTERAPDLWRPLQVYTGSK